MLLKEWLKVNQIKVGTPEFREFAERTITTPSYLMAVIYGRSISAALAKRIEEETEGQVSRMECLYPEEYAKVA